MLEIKDEKYYQCVKCQNIFATCFRELVKSCSGCVAAFHVVVKPCWNSVGVLHALMTSLAVSKDAVADV